MSTRLLAHACWLVHWLILADGGRGGLILFVFFVLTCPTICRYAGKTYDLSVATLQTAALMLFNNKADEDSISFPEVTTLLNLEPDVCKRVMHSLSCGK